MGHRYHFFRPSSFHAAEHMLITPRRPSTSRKLRPKPTLGGMGKIWSECRRSPPIPLIGVQMAVSGHLLVGGMTLCQQTPDSTRGVAAIIRKKQLLKLDLMCYTCLFHSMSMLPATPPRYEVILHGMCRNTEHLQLLPARDRSDHRTRFAALITADPDTDPPCLSTFDTPVTPYSETLAMRTRPSSMWWARNST